MWRQIFLIYLLTIRVDLQTRRHNVWRQGLHDCLKQIQPSSVRDTFRTLSEFARTKFQVNNPHFHFPYALVGEIRNDPSTSSRRWWIEHNSKTVIQWDIIEVRIFTKDSQCSEFYIEWKWEHSTSRFCGFFFGDNLKPLKRYSRGSVTFSQRLAVNSKEESRFQLAFHVVQARTTIFPRSFPAYSFNPSLTHVDYEYGLLKFLLVGSSPVVLLKITVSEPRFRFHGMLELRDGPSPESSDMMCQIDFRSERDCGAHAHLTTSFQAYFLYYTDIETDSPIPGFELTWKSELTYANIPDEDLPEVIWGTSYYHHKRPASGNGLELKIISNILMGSTVSNLRHVYKGPSMHTTSQDEICQYGGLWIYTGDSLKNLSDSVLVARDCTSSSTGMSLLVSEEMYVPPRKYFFIASVQYYGISESTVSYSTNSSGIEIPHFYNVSTLDESDEYKTFTIDLLGLPQILANMKERKSFNFKYDNSLGKAFQVTVRVCTLYTTSHVMRGDCSCQMHVFRNFFYITNENWCEDGISKRIGLETFTTQPLEQAMNECLVAEIMYPINITLTCKQCQEPSFVVSKITSVINLPDNRWARKESYLSENSYSTWLRRYDGWIQHDNYVPLDIAIAFQQRPRQSDYPKTMFQRYMIVITRCVNGRKVKTTRSMQLGDSIHSYVPHCRDACHVSIEQVPGQVPIHSNLFGIITVDLQSGDPDGDFSGESHSGKHLLIPHNTSPNQRYASWKMTFMTCREKNAYLPSVMTIEMANDIVATILNYTALTRQHQHYQQIPILCLQDARLGLKKVMLLGDKYIEDVSDRVCRKCSNAYCSLISPSDDQLCPFLVVKGTTRVIGYTLRNCVQRVEIPSIVCWPLGANIDGKKRAISKATVVDISAAQTNCPLNSHKLNSEACLTLPHLIHDIPVATTDNCTCDATGLPIFASSAQREAIEVIQYIADLRAMGFFPPLILHEQVKWDKGNITEKQTLHFSDDRGTLEQIGNRIYSVSRESLQVDRSGQETKLDSSLCFPGIELCRVKLRSVSRECPYGFVTCGDGTCIVESSRCDGQTDCVGGEDELGCSAICTRPHPTSVCSECSIGEDCRCHVLYFQCSSGGCVAATAICDGVLACTDGSDEVMCPSPWQQLPPAYGCATAQVPDTCSRSIKSFNIFKQICVYSGPTDSSGEHLRFCEHFQCSLGLNKCQEAYCIPVHYICDKVCDCPVCDDEIPCLVDDMQLVKLSCPGMVKCKAGYPCVHALHVQDGEAQCEETHDDEVHYPRCPAHCLCHGTSITCGSYDDISSSLINEFTALSAANHDLHSLSILQSLWAVCEQRCGRLLYLDVSQVEGWDAGFLRSVGEHHRQLYWLNAAYNHFGILEFSLLKNVRRKLTQLYVHHCGIHEIEHGVFIGTNLHILDLSYNDLHMLRDTSFGQMHQLKHIFLQNNRIEVLDLRIFRESSHLLSLHLQNNRILDLWFDPSHWMSAARLIVVRSDEEVVCCIIPTTRSCYVGENTFHTCHTLLLRPGNKFILLTLGVPVLLINISAMVYIIFWKSRQRQAIKRQIITSSLYAITDGLYGFHLVGLAIADILYGENFTKYREIWKANTVCSLIETTFSFCLTVSSSLIIHMCVVLIQSIINLSATVSDNKYKLTLVSIIVGNVIFGSVRRLLIMNAVSVKANSFCFPFVVDGMATLSTTQLAYEGVSFSLQLVVCAASVVGLVLVIWLINKHRKKLAGNRNAKQGSHSTVKLFIYIGLVLLSKLGVLVVWLSILAGLSAQPEVVLLLVSCVMSVWPLCHPFMHTLKLK